MNEKGCIVLAEDAQPLDEIDIGRAPAQLRDAEEDLSTAKDPSETERHHLEQAVEIARARVEAAEAR